ncbi:hypothetical protein [Asticcacaulis sp. MM231]|uniref:hypothetical protein n=1 Tax=Asticcacaulis sp. MM231 TaxID=3157666 RepID=UPI0032D586F0
MTESTREGLAIGFRWEPASHARGEGLFVKGRQTLLHTLTTLSGAERFYHEMTRLAVEGVDLLNLLDDGHVRASNPVGSGRKTLNDTARDERHAAVRSMADRLADCRTEMMFSSHDSAYDFWRFGLETGGYATDGVSSAPPDDDQDLSASPAETAASRAYDLPIHALARVFAELHACDTRGELILPVVTRAGLAYLWILNYLPLGRARRGVAHMAALQILTGQGGGLPSNRTRHGLYGVSG